MIDKDRGSARYPRSLIRALILAVAAGTSYGATLDGAVQGRVRAMTFEVVVKKPETDSLSYEKPLPLDLLPYRERTDKYQSIGTAFSIGGNKYISAAHVLGATFDSQFGPPVLRDLKGQVYEIEKVAKYSSAADFVVFSLKNDPAGQGLPISRAAAVDATVFAVGNALGEGIVIRDGLLTSRTPENIDGRWEWLRFSAAASPGNSGGPLLDEKGRVIGIVLRKSPNENLNYAAPISIVLDAPEGVATVDTQVAAKLPVLDLVESRRVRFEFSPGSSLAELSSGMTNRWAEQVSKLKEDLLSKNAERIFPRGDAAKQILHATFDAGFLHLIAMKPDGSWDIFAPNEIKNATLPENGYVNYGYMPSLMLVKVRRPDNVNATDFYTDSQAYLDYILRAVGFRRRIGTEDIKVTSLGKAKTESVHTDSYGRKWQLRTWVSEYDDRVIVSLALPVPDGYVAMLRQVFTGGLHDSRGDLQHSADFAYVSYTGSLAQWRDFLKQGPLLPAGFSSIELAYEYGQSFRYKSPRVEFQYPHSYQQVNENSQLSLLFSYLEDADKVVWDVAALQIAEKESGGSGVFLRRQTKPAASLPAVAQTEFQKMLKREYPYDGSVIEVAGLSYAEAIYPFPTPRKGTASEPRLLYSLSYSADGKRSQKEISKALTKWFTGLRVIEQ